VLGKHLGSGGVPHSISHPLYCIGAARETQSGIELHDDLIIPMIIETHDVIDLLMLTCCNDLIEQWMILVPHIGPIDAFHQNYRCLLG
jgi:hypothetical protein